MKTYSRPILNAKATININEPIYLLYSGYMTGSMCFTSASYVTQGWEESRKNITLQADASHDASLWGGDGHGCNGQYTIITFSQDVSEYAVGGYILDPNNVDPNTGNVNTWPIELSKTGKQARAITGWHCNDHENIGMGNFQLHLPGFTSEDQVPSDLIVAIDFYDDGLNPQGAPFRYGGT